MLCAFYESSFAIYYNVISVLYNSLCCVVVVFPSQVLWNIFYISLCVRRSVENKYAQCLENNLVYTFIYTTLWNACTDWWWCLLAWCICKCVARVPNASLKRDQLHMMRERARFCIFRFHAYTYKHAYSIDRMSGFLCVFDLYTYIYVMCVMCRSV